jgi:hypothetical protein
VNPALSTSEAVNPALSTSEAVNPALSTSEAVNPALRTSEAVNPALRTSEAVNPALRNDEAVNPALSTSEAVNPALRNDEASPFAVARRNLRFLSFFFILLFVILIQSKHFESDFNRIILCPTLFDQPEPGLELCVCNKESLVANLWRLHRHSHHHSLWNQGRFLL